LLDVDGNGVLDVVVSKDSQAQQLALYVADARGRYTDRTAELVTTVPMTGYAVTVGDFDGNAAPDVIAVTEMPELVPPRYYANVGGRLANSDPAGWLSPPWVLRTSVSGVVLGDLDGDGDADLIVGAAQSMLYGDGRHRVLRNDGHGNFTLAAFTSWAQFTRRVRLSDVDRDGDLDLLEANGRVMHGHGMPYYGGNELVHFNDGRANFTAVPMPAEDWSNSITPADVDGDGDEDLVVANPGQDRLYLNLGGQAFADATGWLPVETDDARDIAAADVDGDRDIDLVVASVGQDRLYLNDGAGRFRDVTGTQLPVDSVTTATIGSADFDGDGDADRLLATAGQPRLYLNGGSGGFIDVTARLPVLQHDFTDVAILDADLDGDCDAILATNSHPAANTQVLLRNDGRGTFSRAPPALLPSRDRPAFLAVGDLDSDQDRDVLLWSSSGEAWVLRNLEQQLHAPGVSARARVSVGHLRTCGLRRRHAGRGRVRRLRPRAAAVARAVLGHAVPAAVPAAAAAGIHSHRAGGNAARELACSRRTARRASRPASPAAARAIAAGVALQQRRDRTALNRAACRPLTRRRRPVRPQPAAPPRAVACPIWTRANT
jgi:hypothetical protein